ncbi:hypothetical protein [Pseudoalteromonas sp. S2755]|uniref:hypothetical protein n=1 Tax=Pseudoalteromonas sp. S2755 TaxID=2066523 RepID=UPI00110B9BD3|nr:hypothetical protein [Pseudoalteromonas sp. S2755]TMN34921.1 hypothetical protein CWC03_16080 [Pseudoalteromonas sp. S2755]
MLMNINIESNFPNDFLVEGQFFKVINSESEFSAVALTPQGEQLFQTSAKAGFEITTNKLFNRIVLQSKEPQTIELWVSQHRLSYDSPTKGNNQTYSFLSEHYGGTQRILPFEAKRLAVTLFSDTHDFWYGGKGCSPETGIPVRAGTPCKVEGSSELYVSINEPPLYISGSTYTTVNALDGNEGRYGGDYGAELPDYEACVSTAHAVYIVEEHISQYRINGVIRMSEQGANLLNLTGDIADVIVVDYDKDRVAALYENGLIMVYEMGQKVAQYDTLKAKVPLNWKKLLYDGTRFIAYNWGSASGWYTPSDTTTPVFTISSESNLAIRKTFYDKYRQRVYAICNSPGNQYFYDLTGASGVCETFPHALGRPIGDVFSSIASYPDVRFSSTHITATAGNRGFVFNRESTVITELVDVQYVAAQSRGAVYAIKGGQQLISEDDGVTFMPIPSDNADFGSGTVLGTFSTNLFITYPLTKNTDGRYRARLYDTEVSQASAISAIRVLKEVI